MKKLEAMQYSEQEYWSPVAKVFSMFNTTTVSSMLCCVYRFFQEVLHALFTLVTMETDPRCLDNICAAVCRMIMTQPDAIPLDQVITFVQKQSYLYRSNYTPLSVA